MRAWWIAAIALSTVASPGPARPTGPTEYRLEQFRRSLAVRVEIGGERRLLQLDTGGGVTFISPAIAKRLGCQKGARIVGFRMTGDKLEAPRCDNVPMRIDGHDHVLPVVGVYEVGEFNAKGVSVDGLLALDAFAGRTITLDSAGLRLIVETPQSAARRTARAVELPARLVREIGGRALTVDIDVPSPMGPLAFELDSGNGGTLLIAKPYAGAFGFDSAKGPRMGSFAVGKGLVARGFVMPAGITIDGNLGMPFLREHVVTIDLARGRVWVAPSRTRPPAGMGEPPPPPAPAASGTGH